MRKSGVSGLADGVFPPFGSAIGCAKTSNFSLGLVPDDECGGQPPFTACAARGRGSGGVTSTASGEARPPPTGTHSISLVTGSLAFIEVFIARAVSQHGLEDALVAANRAKTCDRTCSMPLEAARTVRKQPEPFEIAAVFVVQRIVGTANVENVVEEQDGFQQLSRLPAAASHRVPTTHAEIGKGVCQPIPD